MDIIKISIATRRPIPRDTSEYVLQTQQYQNRADQHTTMAKPIRQFNIKTSLTLPGPMAPIWQIITKQ